MASSDEDPPTAVPRRDGGRGPGAFRLRLRGSAAWRGGSAGRARAPRKIVVVGAGLAGLAGSYELLQAGHHVTIVEARERPGGRVHTVRGLFSEDLDAEAGVTFVPDIHHLTLSYIRLANRGRVTGHVPALLSTETANARHAR